MRIQAYGFGFGHGFVFGDSLRLQAYGSAFRHFVWTFGKAFPMQECSRRKGSGKSREDVKGLLHPKGTYANVVSSSVYFPIISPGS